MKYSEYLNERTLRKVRTLCKLVEYDLNRLQGENAPAVDSTLDQLDVAYTICDNTIDNLVELRILLGKMADEREYESEDGEGF